MAKEFSPDQLYGPKAGVVLDPTPIRMPSGFKRPETLMEQVRRLVRTQLSEDARNKGFETFEEANDFDIPDDPVDPSTPFEEFFDPALGRSLTPDEMRRYDNEYRREYLKAQGDAIEAEERRQAIQEHLAQLRASKASGGSKNPKNEPTDDPPPAPAK